MIVFCTRVSDTAIFDDACVPGLRRAAEADTVIVEADTDMPIGAAYDEVLDHFQADETVEAVVFLDDAAELLAVDTCDRIRQALRSDAAVLGAVGSREPVDSRWWSGELVGSTEEPGGLLSGESAGLVDALDGRLLVVPAARLDLRFGPAADPVEAAATFCERAARAGVPLRAGSVPVRHHRVFDTTAVAAVPKEATAGEAAPAPVPGSAAPEMARSASVSSGQRTEPMVTRSPQREDVVVARCLGPAGTYLDIGGGDPATSPTAGLAGLGWTGLVVEPHLGWAAGFAAERGPEAVVAATVVGQAWPPGAGLALPAVSVGHLLDHLGGVDLLRVDNDGDEIAVLGDIDWASVSPRIVLVSGARPIAGDDGFPRRTERVDGPTGALLARHGYVVGLFDGVSTFFVAETDHELRRRIDSPANSFDGFVDVSIARADRRGAGASG